MTLHLLGVVNILGAAISNTNDETQETRARILVANKACYCLQNYVYT